MDIYISISKNPPPGFVHSKPSVKFLLSNRIALFADSFQQVMALSSSFVNKFRGVLITEGKNFLYKQIGQERFHLTIPPMMLPNLHHIARSYLGMMATTAQLLQKEIQLKNRFRKFSEVTVEGLVFHENGLIKDVNIAFAELVGYKGVSEIIGKKNFDFIAPESHKVVKSHIESEFSIPMKFPPFIKTAPFFL